MVEILSLLKQILEFMDKKLDEKPDNTETCLNQKKMMNLLHKKNNQQRTKNTNTKSNAQ